MSEYVWIILALVVAGFLLISRRGRMPIKDAKTALVDGAVVVDVRSEQEFAGGAIEGAVNVPLNGLIRGVTKKYPEKDTVLLCHCASGARSASAVKQLRAAGYENVHNLGGYGRAAKVLV
ncbi:rhodanese-like domain-containing protein [Pelagicoccus sp. SDUM812002]|uniref:rhodanese-like domain-containing protein n=1 Tax=Pelagicoccus sp. SDUM812002 TaxID=3041266 RepID=UPI00280FDB8D|nr:rhodanese-like domain-containing protein [Pelagicoccus sp. SDUM812002]MDQ8187009.1 rhodanese-like domain-containing protein [Pelagicoccus sp. SDUM812002]